MPICGGTSSTGALQSVSEAGAVAGYVLTYVSNAALPTWQATGAPVPAALTEVNDTNVTLTLGGTPATALLQAVSITAGWSGQLSLARGGTNANLTASNGGIFYSTASAGAILAGTATANQVLLSGSSTTPAWSTATYPATTTINQILYSSSANVIAGLATANNGVLLTSNTGVPSIGTATVAVGGTGDTSFTTYMPICGGTSSTGALQSVSEAGAVAGYVLTYVSNAALPTWQATAAPTGAALTEVNDTNVTLTLGGTPSTALLQATSITAGWSGQLSLARGGTNANLTASNGGIFYSTGSAGAILAGTATANQVLLSGASTTPAWSTATYPATVSNNQALYANGSNTITAGTLPVAAGGTGNTTFTSYSVICAGTTATGIFQNVSGVGSAGQVLTSQGASALPVWSNPTNGVIVNQTSSSVTMAAGSQYYINDGSNLVTLTLPTTAAQGDTYIIVGGSSGGWKVAQNASQQINFNSKSTTSGTGGSLASTNQYNCITIKCITANTTFVVFDSEGAITVV